MLDIESPAGSVDPIKGAIKVFNLGTVKLDPFESNYFLQGYNAIETQISNVTMRDEGEVPAITADAKKLVFARERLKRFDVVNSLVL